MNMLVGGRQSRETMVGMGQLAVIGSEATCGRLLDVGASRSVWG